MPSGKQLLLHLLEKNSIHPEEQNLSETSEDIRIALLLHGSTNEDMWFNAERVAWSSDPDKHDHSRQGLSVRGKDYFISDIFESMINDAKIPESVKTDFPKLTQEEFHSVNHIIWLILTAFEWNSYHDQIEDKGQINQEQVNKWLNVYRQKLQAFREDPGDFVGYVDEDKKKECKEKFDRIGK